MPQYQVWENEYQNPQLVTGGNVPQKDVLRFLQYIKHKEKLNLAGLKVLDLGSGAGKNANYLASLGADVTGIEIATTALEMAKERAKMMRVNVTYKRRSMGKKYPFADDRFDFAIDITSSNSLSEHERKNYLHETHRVLKKGGLFFVRALCKDGDKNAKNLLLKNPGPEKDTYIMQELGLVERVFAEIDFKKMYEQFFKIEKIIRKTAYTRFQGQSYKRVYLLAYMKKI